MLNFVPNKIILTRDLLLIKILRELVKDKNDDNLINMINILEESYYGKH
jgi:hypothetical protein